MLKIPDSLFVCKQELFHCGYLGKPFKVQIEMVYWHHDSINIGRNGHWRYIVRGKMSSTYDVAEIELCEQMKGTL
jgi:hypothetical protein